MASQAEKRGLPPQLPVMASLVESGLENLNFGDADSVGFFQMRASVWNQGEYAGYGEDPDKQIDWFLDTAERVKAQRIDARPARRPTPASSASGSPTWSGRPSSTATATSSSSRRPTGS